jgi:hypothetical protein
MTRLGHGTIVTCCDAASKLLMASFPSVKSSDKGPPPARVWPPPWPWTVVASSSGAPEPASRLAARVA